MSKETAELVAEAIAIDKEARRLSREETLEECAELVRAASKGILSQGVWYGNGLAAELDALAAAILARKEG